MVNQTKSSADIPVDPWEVSFLIPLSLQWQRDELGMRLPAKSELAAREIARGVAPSNDAWAQEIAQTNRNWVIADANYPQVATGTDAAEQELAYAEFCYFHPIVRNFLYSNRDELRKLPTKQPAKPMPGSIGTLPISDGEGEEADKRQRWRDYIAQARNQNLRILRRTGIKQLSVEYRMRLHESGGSTSVISSFTVDSCWLYLFDTGIAMLEVRLVHAESRGLDSGMTQPIPLTARMAMHLQDSLRRIYPTYWYTDGAAGHCPTRVKLTLDSEHDSPFGDDAESGTKAAFMDHVALNREPLGAAWWQLLLDPLRPHVTSIATDAMHRSMDAIASQSCSPLRYELIEDERAVTFSYLGVPNPRQFTEGDWLRLAELDDEGLSNTFSYSPEFIDKPIQQFAYDRFYHSTGELPAQDETHSLRWLCSGHAFVAVGRSADDKFFRDEVIGARGHFRRHYFSLGMIAHLQRASLLRFKHELAETMETYNPQARNERLRRKYLSRIGDLLDRMNHFRSVYWTREVSNQVQGRELFDLWRRKLEIEPLFNEVFADAQFANELLVSWAEDRQADAAGYLSWLAAAFLIIAPILSLWSTGLAEQTLWNSLLLVVGLSVLCALLAIVRRALIRIRDVGFRTAWRQFGCSPPKRILLAVCLPLSLSLLLLVCTLALSNSVVQASKSRQKNEEAGKDQMRKIFSQLEQATLKLDGTIGSLKPADEVVSKKLDALVTEAQEIRNLIRKGDVGGAAK